MDKHKKNGLSVAWYTSRSRTHFHKRRARQRPTDPSCISIQATSFPSQCCTSPPLILYRLLPPINISTVATAVPGALLQPPNAARPAPRRSAAGERGLLPKACKQNGTFLSHTVRATGKLRNMRSYLQPPAQLRLLWLGRRTGFFSPCCEL